ncbi:hypothetical protein ACQEVG_14645 [Streptomyces sp. CA-135486]|uniref:hypothetical protein n=1 Tax=Streptomyces sp. CA-135486 TaxID=3240049 RepID=UPI003D8CA317
MRTVLRRNRIADDARSGIADDDAKSGDEEQTPLPGVPGRRVHPSGGTMDA